MSKTELLPGFVGPFVVRYGTVVYDATGKYFYAGDPETGHAMAQALARVLNSHAEVVEAGKAALKRGTFSFDAREDVGRVEYQLAEALRKAEVSP